MDVDFEAEGLLEGVQDARAREARLELLRALLAEGFSLDELRAAAAEDRLALLPVEHVLAAEEPPRYTLEDLAERDGARRAASCSRRGGRWARRGPCRASAR